MNKFTVMCIICVLLGITNTAMIIEMILDKPSAITIPQWPKASCYEHNKDLYVQGVTGDFGMVLSCLHCEDHKDKYITFQELRMYYTHVDCELARAVR